MDIKVRDAGDLKQVARQLRDVADGKELRRELTGGIRKVLQPVAARVRAVYRAQPSRHRGGRSLRGALAKATRVEVRTSGRMAGARIRVDGRKLPAGDKALPRYVEAEKRPWNHPVFGDRDTWVTQVARPTFYAVVTPHADDAGRAIDQVIADVKQKLERGR